MTLVFSQLAGNYIISVNPQQMTTTETIFQIPLMASARTFGYLKNRVPDGYLCGSYFTVATCKYCYIVPRCIGVCGPTTMKNDSVYYIL